MSSDGKCVQRHWLKGSPREMILPQEGVTYYDIPLHFGAGLNRCAVIAGKAVIVDPRTRRVVEDRVGYQAGEPGGNGGGCEDKVDTGANSVYNFPLIVTHFSHAPLLQAPDPEIVYRDRKRFTYREIRGRIGRLASAVQDRGLPRRHGRRLGLGQQSIS
jgi:hypothetical protein